MSENKNDIKPIWIDPDDAPELDDAWFQKADLYHGEKLVRRGRPAGTGQKISTTIRLDADILSQFRARGKGWQTHMNGALREWLGQHPN